MKKRGFRYTVTQEQIDAHRKRSIEQIFSWLEETNKFIYQAQTKEERSIMKKMKNIERDWE